VPEVSEVRTVPVCYLGGVKAIRYHRFGPPEVLRWEEAPTPRAGRAQLSVRVRATALNPKDVLTRKGKLGPLSPRFPIVPGQDFAGVVESVGKGVKGFAVGEEVFGMIGGLRTGANAEVLVVPEDEVALAPRRASFVEAAAIPLTGLTALQALRDDVKLRAGEEVALNGASGGVGVVAVQIAKILGARVVAVCSSRNVDRMRELGADEVLPYDERPLLERARTFDVVFDIFGTAPWPAARPLLGPGGRYVTAIPRPKGLLRDLGSRLTGGPAYTVVVTSRRRDLQLLAQWVDQGKLRCVVDRTWPIEAAAEAHAYLETRRARGKVVLTVGHA